MRIDKSLSEKFGSRTKAAEAIERGLVLVNGKEVSPSYDLKESDEVTFVQPQEYFVSNGGYKLSKALKDFGFSVVGKTFADVGASNGGFTDCLFKNGAKKVYCIDVGESQLDASLRDKNIVIYDNFNARNLSSDMFSESLDGVTIDVSFISLTYILGAVASTISDKATVIALIKPQFECESRKVGKNGIVRNGKTHKRIIKKIYDFAISCKLSPVNLTNTPVCEGKNIEYLIMLVKNGGVCSDFEELVKRVKL